jgi:hypothetical protein
VNGSVIGGVALEEEIGCKPPICDADLFTGLFQLVTQIIVIALSIIIKFDPTVLSRPRK